MKIVFSIVAVLFLPSVSIHAYAQHQKLNTFDSSEWTGNLAYHNTSIGPDFSEEYLFNVRFTNGVGTCQGFYKLRSKNSNITDRGDGASYLSIIMYDDEYSLSVTFPKLKHFDAEMTLPIDYQKLGNNVNRVSGDSSETNTIDRTTEITQIHWDFVRKPKKGQTALSRDHTFFTKEPDFIF